MSVRATNEPMIILNGFMIVPDDVKEEYFEHLEMVLPKAHRASIIEHLRNTNVGNWIVESSISFAHTKAFQMYADMRAFDEEIEDKGDN